MHRTPRKRRERQEETGAAKERRGREEERDRGEERGGETEKREDTGTEKEEILQQNEDGETLSGCRCWSRQT